MARSAVYTSASEKDMPASVLSAVIGGLAEGLRAFLRYQSTAANARPADRAELARRALAGR